MRIISLLFTLVALAGVVGARESILSFPIPNANREPRARLYTDNLYEQDFKTDHKHILAEYFTGGDSNLLASFRQEFEKPLYINITAKPLMNNNLEDFQLTVHSYYKPYEFHQAKFLNWLRDHRPAVTDFLPANARKMNGYKGDLNNPIAATERERGQLDLKTTFGKEVFFKDGGVCFLQDNRLNPFRWMAPNNDIHHHEASPIFMENHVADADRVRVRQILEDYRTGKDRGKRILFKYRAVIKLTDYRKEMGEASIFDMYEKGEFENGKDLITAVHRRWSECAKAETVMGRWTKKYMNARLERPFAQVSICINMSEGGNRYILQEFMVFNKDYASTTKGYYRPVSNEIMSDHMYEGGCSGFVGWNRLAVDALKIDGVSCGKDMATAVEGCDYADVAGHKSKVITKEVSGTIDVTRFNYFARKNHFFPGEDGYYTDDGRMHGFSARGTKEYEPGFLPSIFWAGFMCEMAGPYKLEIEIKRFDLTIE